jgi:hypothetical protein
LSFENRGLKILKDAEQQPVPSEAVLINVASMQRKGTIAESLNNYLSKGCR